jgi:hypothetical protein
MLDGNPLVVSDGLADYFEEMHQWKPFGSENTLKKNSLLPWTW